MTYLLINALQAVFLAVWSVFWMSSAILVTLVTFSGELALVMARRGYSPGIIRASGTRLKVEPLPEGVDWSKPHIFAMNHESMLDIPIAFAVIPSNLRFVAKHVLKYVPFLGWYMWATGMIFINRSNRREAMQSLAKAGEKIREGRSIIVYPEGTRSRTGKILPFKKGPFVLALEAKVPIIPVAVSGSGKVVPSGGFKIRAGEVRVKVGQPIPTAHRSAAERDELLREVRDAIIQLHRDIGGAGGDDNAVAAAGKEGVAEERLASAERRAKVG